MGKGNLIDFEGGDRTGKSTQIKILAERLRAAGIDVVLTKEPGGSSKGKEIRHELLFGNPSPERELKLFIEDRVLHFRELIIPAVKEGKWVLCDRNGPSTVAYQGYGRGMDIEMIKKLNAEAMQGQDFDMVILLDMDPEKALKRTKKENRFDEEAPKFLRRVRDGFLEQWKGSKTWFCVGANQSEEEVADIIWREIQRRFLK